MAAKPPIIWNGTFAKLLVDDLLFNNTARIITIAVDPTSVATLGEAGSLALRSNGSVYVKTDAGTTTNWSLLTAGGGGGALTQNTINANTTISDAYDVVKANTTGGTFTLTLHSAATAESKEYFIANIGTQNLNIAPNGADTIESETSQILQPGGRVTLIPDGTSNWIVF